MSGLAPATTLLDAAKGDLVLRISGTSHHGQVVRLQRPKCVIGSGPACTLRVRARGVRPVHCVILRGPACTVIRRWSADTRLNGRAFTDARLSPGDRLDIGPVEFEVLDTGDGSQNPPEPVQRRDAPGSGPSIEHTRAIEDLRHRLALANGQGRRRVRTLVERLRTARRELDQWQVRQGPQDRAEEPPEAAPPQPSDSAPVDTRAVLSRLGLDLPEDDAGQDRPSGLEESAYAESGRSPQVETRPSGPGATAGIAPDRPTPDALARPSEEESIDEYMARLLDRVRAGSGPSRPFNSPVEATAPNEPGLPSQPGVDGIETTAVSASQDPPAPMTRRAAAPQDSASISAMRELANLSAHAAIDSHARRRLLRMSGAKLVVLLLSLLCGGAMIWMWCSFGASTLAFYSGLVGLLIATYWGVQYAILTGRLMVTRSGHLLWKPRKGAADVPPPPPPPDNDASREG